MHRYPPLVKVLKQRTAIPQASDRHLQFHHRNLHARATLRLSPLKNVDHSSRRYYISKTSAHNRKKYYAPMP